MRDDFDRLQAQLKKRQEREQAVVEQQRYETELRVHKANLLNQKGQQALEKVRKNQRRLELQSVKTFKANMKEVEDRRMRA